MKKNGEYWDKYTFNADFGDRGSFYFSLAIGDALTDERKLEAKGRMTVDGKTFSWRNDFKESAWSHSLADEVRITAGKADMSGTLEKSRFVNAQDGAGPEHELSLYARFRARGQRQVGHLIHYETPQAAASAIRDFLRDPAER